MCIVFTYDLAFDHPLANMLTRDDAFDASDFLLNVFLTGSVKTLYQELGIASKSKRVI